MAKPQKSASELSKTLAGQWTKTEKRAAASRSIAKSKQAAHQAVKDFKLKKLLAQ
jgi:hypothetical protein